MEYQHEYRITKKEHEKDLSIKRHSIPIAEYRARWQCRIRRHNETFQTSLINTLKDKKRLLVPSRRRRGAWRLLRAPPTPLPPSSSARRCCSTARRGRSGPGDLRRTEREREMEIEREEQREKRQRGTKRKRRR